METGQQESMEQKTKECKTTAIAKPTDHEDFVVMERMDEQQILKELEGEYLTEFVYFIEKRGQKPVAGLSYAGVKQVQKEMAESGQPIVLSDLEYHENGDGTAWIARVKATNKTTGVEMYGVSVAKKEMFTRGGQFPDEFALQKAVSKAQRNAIRAIIPEKFAIALIARKMKDKGLKPSTRTDPTDEAVERANEGDSEFMKPANGTPFPRMASEKQVAYLKRALESVGVEKAMVLDYLQKVGIKQVENLTIGQASEIIGKLQEAIAR